MLTLCAIETSKDREDTPGQFLTSVALYDPQHIVTVKLYITQRTR